MCGLSACGPAQTNNNANSTSGFSVSNDSSSKNSSKNVSLKDIAKKCNFKPLDSDENDYLFDAVLISGDQDASGEKFKEDYACAIKNANPGDPVAEKFSDKLESLDIRTLSINFGYYDKYMPPYFGSEYYIYPIYDGINIVKFR